ncbi:hypothetical protein CIRG_03646 [Coccidioides immitis RMSCC 2394]|uniref:Uncharacterized protein n=1 Tax=Coccidioides immitis RMSCC 2394 TaxID=404692 RepID=A0A0J6Y8A3_COCIT|nr:hypothetical protein CIRG_03646 [Coccidioides immitis RMSCC 2394]
MGREKEWQHRGDSSREAEGRSVWWGEKKANDETSDRAMGRDGLIMDGWMEGWWKLVDFRPAARPEDAAGRSPSSCNRSLSCTKNRKLVGQLRSTFKSTPSSSTVFLEDEGKKKREREGDEKAMSQKRPFPRVHHCKKDAICNPPRLYDAPLS